MYAYLAKGTKAYQAQINFTLERKPQKHALYLGQWALQFYLHFFLITICSSSVLTVTVFIRWLTEEIDPVALPVLVNPSKSRMRFPDVLAWVANTPFPFGISPSSHSHVVCNVLLFKHAAPISPSPGAVKMHFFPKTTPLGCLSPPLPPTHTAAGWAIHHWPTSLNPSYDSQYTYNLSFTKHSCMLQDLWCQNALGNQWNYN